MYVCMYVCMHACTCKHVCMHVYNHATFSHLRSKEFHQYKYTSHVAMQPWIKWLDGQPCRNVNA